MSWDTQVVQYPARDTPGIHYFRGDIGQGMWVDCLLHYDPDGSLSGILNHCPQDIPPFEKKGAVNMWVRPDRVRQGIGTALVDEAFDKWRFFGEDQRLTPNGAGFARHLHEKRGGVTPNGVRYDRRKPSAADPSQFGGG